MSPVRPEWVNGDNFTKVSPDMVRALGGDFIAAGVAARIQFRTSYFGYDRDGQRWWRCSMSDLALDLGITDKQVRRCFTVLETAGMLQREQHKHEGPWDRTMSLSLVFDLVTPSAPEGGPSAPEGDSTSAP